MKSELKNYWIIIRWATVIVIYVATVAVAVDQVRIRDEAIQGKRSELAEVKKSGQAATMKAREMETHCDDYETQKAAKKIENSTRGRVKFELAAMAMEGVKQELEYRDLRDKANLSGQKMRERIMGDPVLEAIESSTLEGWLVKCARTKM